MNKYQVIWLIIRLAGVYFAFLTLVSFFGLVGSVPALFTLPKIDVPGNKNANVSTVPPAIPVRPIQPVSPNANLPEGVENKDKTDESITDKFKGENVKNFVWFLILTGFYGAVTWYLLRDGRALYNILNREKPPESGKTKEAEVTTLNLSDEEK
ncbi:MAG: hypothetical protein JSS81_22200 [Acidobacteria bacterium]|nr:hypothetical protein [Acidobacteriota bacterium]